MNIHVLKNRAGWFCATGLAGLISVGLSMQVAAQSCGGSIGMLNSPNTLQLTQVPLGEIVQVTLNPAKSNLSDPMTISSVAYALTCANNDDDVPCAFGNDVADQGGQPIDFAGNVGGDCGATDGSTVNNGDGTITFSFAPIVLDTAGCMITFDVEVNDKGTDANPLFLTSAAATNGTCAGTTGSAAGSAGLTLQTVPDIELLKEISLDGVTWFDANDSATAPIAEFPSGAQYRLTVTNTGTADLTNVVINDAELGIVGVAIADLPVATSVVLDSGDIPALSVATRCDRGGTFENVASVDAESADDGTPVSDSDPATLICVGIDVRKTGDAEGKVGDAVDYTFTLQNLSGQALSDCTAEDSLLGTLHGPNAALPDGDTVINDSRVVLEGDPDPLPNTVTLSCEVVGGVNTVNLSANDDHSVALIQPAIEVTKSGPASAKVGDEITYTIGFANTGDGTVENCTGSDTVLGPLGEFVAGVDRTFNYTVDAGDANPLENTVTITCDVSGFNNRVSDSDSHSLDWVSPAVSLTKECRPDPVLVGEEITWAITVENTGTADLDCVLSDPTADINESFLLAPAGSESFNNSRIAISDDVPLLSNTASVLCDVVGFQNQVDDSDSADCVVEEPGEEICRTPGFWGTHAGTEKRRSSDLAQTVIDAAGGSLSVCGQIIDNTNVGNVNSAVEAMCVRIQGEQQRQLARQLTAMALNCVVSGGNADCSGTSVEGLFADANASCTADDGQVNFWIERVDCFNNGGQFDEVAGECLIDDLDPDNCQNRELDEATDIFDGIRPLPGPAGSSGACRDANGNGVKVVPAI